MTAPRFLDSLNALQTLLDQSKGLQGAVERAADLVSTALAGGHKLLVCGNGGSAADAMHFATEFVCRFDRDRRPYPAICLSASGADLTAIGNDYSYEQAFERQVHAYGTPGDLLVAFSSSGNSRNILLAIEAANQRGIQSVAFLGKGGGFTAGKATMDLLVPGQTTARIQEVHKLLLHAVCEAVEFQLTKLAVP